MSQLCRIPVEECVGRGTGLNAGQLQHKVAILKRAIALHRENTKPEDVLDVLSTFGGFEIVMMCGAMLQAAELKMVLLVDGFIATTAFLTAYHICPAVKDYAFFCHQSDEHGHARVLQFLEVRPILNLSMRLGEGTGAAVAYPILISAVNFLNGMASFASAGVSNRS